MNIDKQYKVSIHAGESLICSFTLNTEWDDDEFTDVSVARMNHEPCNDMFTDEAIDIILKTESAHGKESVQGCALEWFLIN